MMRSHHGDTPFLLGSQPSWQQDRCHGRQASENASRGQTKNCWSGGVGSVARLDEFTAVASQAGKKDEF